MSKTISMDDFFGYISIPLYVRGVSLVERPTRLHRMAQALILLTCFSSTTFWVIGITHTIAVEGHYKKQAGMIKSLYYSARLSFDFLSTWALLYYRKKIINYGKRLLDELPLKQQLTMIKLARMTAYFSITCLVINFLHRTYQLSVRFWSPRKPGSWETALILSHYLPSLNQDLVVPITGVYCLFLYLFRCHSQYVLELVHESLDLRKQSMGGRKSICSTNDGNNNDTNHNNSNPNTLQNRYKLLRMKSIERCNTVYYNFRTIQESAEEFDELFSMLPFTWLLYTFCATSLVVLDVANREVDDLIMYFFNNLCVLFVVIHASKLGQLFGKQTTIIEETLVTTDRSPSSTFFMTHKIMTQLQSISNVKMTAWFFFCIDRSLIMSFIASVMTFTVLFLELTNRTDDNEFLETAVVTNVTDTVLQTY